MYTSTTGWLASHMKIDFEGRTALVTGASRGIGLQIAQDLSAAGAELLLTSTVERDSRIANAGLDQYEHAAVDFTDRDATRRFLDRVRSLDALHVCINNAALTRHGPFEDVSEADWDATQDVDLKAPFLLTQAAATVMKKNGYGRVVNISSIWGHLTMAHRAVYTAAKFGLRGMTLSHALELGRHNILVNAVAPGFTRTDMVEKNYTPEHLAELSERVPLGRLATPADVSSAVLYLASSLNTYITGQHILVDGGYSIT